MRLEALLPRASDGCIQCPPPAACNCASGSNCVQINRGCDFCSTFQCIAPGTTGDSNSDLSSTSSGASKGALAGGVVAGLILLALAIGGVWWYRRRSQRLQQFTTREVKDIPASAETVLSRPDPPEKAPTEPNSIRRMYSTSSRTTIDLNPQSQSQHSTPVASRQSVASNPFEDNHSIQTTGTEGTNVIPIALVSPEGYSSTAQMGPTRPVRSPDLNLNLEHVNVSVDSVRPVNYPASQISGISAVSSRNSYMTNASFASDFLNEAPMIITPTTRNVRQVLGVHKAEFINTSAMTSPTKSEGLKPPAIGKRGNNNNSPLASTSFTQSDVISEQSEISPFDDENQSTMASPPGSVTTFGAPLSPGAIRDSNLSNLSNLSSLSDMDSPTLPWARHTDSRPSSMSTQAGSIMVGIESARRVNLGLGQASGPTPRSPYRTTMGRIISPTSGGTTPGTLEQQQQDAIDHARARAQAQGLDENRRTSGSSFMSTMTRADSILESFPFVPPSPISNLPMRSPPVSPLGQQSFSQPSPTESSMTARAQGNSSDRDDDVLPPPPNRRTLGLSTGSQFSTASSGLGSFPFHIDSGNDNRQSSAPSAFSGRQRASLDTLALTSDLASYPLGFDRDSTVPYKP